MTVEHPLIGYPDEFKIDVGYAKNEEMVIKETVMSFRENNKKFAIESWVTTDNKTLYLKTVHGRLRNF